MTGGTCCITKNMLKKSVKFIHNLRIFLFAFILVSFLYTVGVSPVDFTKYMGASFSSAVGMTSQANVPPNPFNSLALQLKEKEERLDIREAQLNERESEIQSPNYVLQNKIIWGMMVGIIVLFVLILINFFLDLRRKKLNK